MTEQSRVKVGFPSPRCCVGPVFSRTDYRSVVRTPKAAASTRSVPWFCTVVVTERWTFGKALASSGAMAPGNSPATRESRHPSLAGIAPHQPSRWTTNSPSQPVRARQRPTACDGHRATLSGDVTTCLEDMTCRTAAVPRTQPIQSVDIGEFVEVQDGPAEVRERPA